MKINITKATLLEGIVIHADAPLHRVHMRLQVGACALVGKVQAVLVDQPRLVLQPLLPRGAADVFPDALPERARVGRAFQPLGFAAELDAVDHACHACSREKKWTEGHADALPADLPILAEDAAQAAAGKEHRPRAARTADAGLLPIVRRGPHHGRQRGAAAESGGDIVAPARPAAAGTVAADIVHKTTCEAKR